MEALVCKEFGAPESLTVEKVANLPSPGPKQVKIAVHAAGFNFFLDTLMVAGKYQVKPPLPFSPGMECAGVIAEVGPEVTELKVADRVMSTPGHGRHGRGSDRAGSDDLPHPRQHELRAGPRAFR